MPHQCTECEQLYKDGSDAILDGCEECGNNKFQFVKAESERDPQSIQEATGSNEDEVQRDARTQMVSDSELSRAERDRRFDQDYNNNNNDNSTTKEREPQKSDNTEVTEDDLPSSPTLSVERDVSKIKDNLNTQFEGIRVLEHGKYEINLTQLFERNTQVISVQEDGKYVINVPETFESTMEDRDN